MTETPGSGEARFPGLDVAAQSPAWDGVTAAVVLARLGPRSALTFFTVDEEPTARALVDRVLGQDDEPRVPVLEMIDERLAARRGDGYRYDDMPEDPEAWRESIARLDEEALERHNNRFGALERSEQMAIIEEIRELPGTWREMPAKRVFSLWMRYCCDAFYAHPWAWNEIGFSGPAYPRGYANLGLDRREHWEVPERGARDPVPWARRAEAARRDHAAAFPASGKTNVPTDTERHDGGDEAR